MPTAVPFEEKKRPRLCLSDKPSSSMLMPYLLAMQIDSFKEFLQKDVAPEDRKMVGLHAAFSSVFPIVSFSGHARLEYISYRLGDLLFDVPECKLRGLTYAVSLKVKIRLVIYDKESLELDKLEVKDIKEQEVYMGEIPLMTDTGSLIINGTERVVVSQLHRSPGVIFDHDKGKTHSSGKLLHSARIIPYRGSWLDFEFDPKDLMHVRIDRRRKLPVTTLLRALNFTSQEILDMFYEKDVVHYAPGTVTLTLQPGRLKGEVAAIDIIDPKTKEVIVEVGRRISARHTRKIEKAGITELAVPVEYLHGKVLAKDIVNKETGEVVLSANSVITEDHHPILIEHASGPLELLYNQ